MPETNSKGYREAIRRIKENFKNKKQRLDLSGLDLTGFPIEVIKLKDHLKILDLGFNFSTSKNNLINKLPKEMVELKDLQNLNLSRTSISELPVEIGELKSLQSLNLSRTSISELPKEIFELKSLQNLNLSETSISELPKEIGELKNLQILHLHNCEKLNIPEEIREKCEDPNSIITYYLENVLNRDKYPLKEVKVLLVGQGRVGKTSLVRYLVENEKCNPSEPSTHGIIRKKWKVDVIDEKTKEQHEVQLNIWDFGGQDIQHQTHQFFLNQRSLYLLVLDAGRDEAGNKLDYWLKKIQTVGKKAPILVAVNKSEDHSLKLDYTDLKDRYNIKEFFDISCEKGLKIDELRQRIIEEVGKIEEVFEPISKNWFEVKDYLENLPRDYISRDEYRQVCRDKGITEIQSQNTLLYLLHELGIMLNFKEYETEVLNPEWVTRGVYKVVTSHRVSTNNGELTPNLLDEELKELNDELHEEGKDYLHYPEEKYRFILDLMKKFDLAYQIENSENYFVPSLLPKDSKYTGDWNEKECLGLRYNYENGLLHERIISSFIVRMNKFILNKTQWLTGVLLHNEHGNRALVKADLADGYINILIDGNPNTRREFLGIIKDKFQDITKGNQPEQEVPLKEYPDVFVSYKLLLELERNGRELSETLVGGQLYEFNVRELLNSVTSFEQRQQERGKDDNEHYKKDLEKRHIKESIRDLELRRRKDEEIEEIFGEYLDDESNIKRKDEISTILPQQDSLAKTVGILVSSFVLILGSLIGVGYLVKINIIPIEIFWIVLIFTLIIFVILIVLSFIYLGKMDSKELPEILKILLGLINNNKQLENKDNNTE